MGRSKSLAKIAQFTVDELSCRHIEIDDAELLYSNHISKDPSHILRVKKLRSAPKFLNNAPDRRRPAVFAQEAWAYIVNPAHIHIPFKAKLEMVELVHDGALVSLAEEQIAEALDGELFMTVLLKAAVSTAFAAERL